MTVLAFRCGGCGRVVGAQENCRGREVRCGGCGRSVRVPLGALALDLPASGNEAGRGVATEPSWPGSARGDSAPPTQEVSLPLLPDAAGSAGMPSLYPPSAGVSLAVENGAPPPGMDQPAASAPTDTEVFAGRTGLETQAVGTSAVGQEAWGVSGAEPGLVERRARPTPLPSRHRIPISFWLLAVLIPTTVTFVAISIMLFRMWLAEVAKKERHPLEDLPDTVEGTVDVGGRPRSVVNPIQQPPESAVLRLGETKRYDGIEVTPLAVRRQLVMYARTQDGRSQVRHSDPMLVLHLRIRNVSDHIIQPFEPMYNVAFRKDWAVYTYLVAGEERYYGPVQDVALERIEGQAFRELWPRSKSEQPENQDQAGPNTAQLDVLETIVLAHQSPNRRRVAEALQGLSDQTVLRWHVQLRKGRQDRLIKGKPYRLWLTTVIPVEFTVGQIEQEKP